MYLNECMLSITVPSGDLTHGLSQIFDNFMLYHSLNNKAAN